MWYSTTWSKCIHILYIHSYFWKHSVAKLKQAICSISQSKHVTGNKGVKLNMIYGRHFGFERAPGMSLSQIRLSLKKHARTFPFTLLVLLVFRNITWTLQVLLNIAPKPKLNPITTIHNST